MNNDLNPYITLDFIIILMSPTVRKAKLYLFPGPQPTDTEGAHCYILTWTYWSRDWMMSAHILLSNPS